MNKNKTVSERAPSRSPPNPKIEKQNNVNKSDLLQQMEVLKRNRAALAKRNIHSVSNLSTNNDRPTKVRRLNECSGSSSTLQQKCVLCNKMISRFENLQSHIDRVHGRKMPDSEIKRPYTNSLGETIKDTKANASSLQQKCPVCNKMISLGENLISHIDKVHGRNKPDSKIKRPYTDDSRGENLKSKIEEAHGSNKPDREIRRPVTDSRGENLKSHAEEVHGSKNPDNEVKKPDTDGLGENLKSVRGSEIKRSYTNRGESSKSNVEEVHGSKIPDFKSDNEKVREMKTSIPLNNKRKSRVHEAKKWVGCDKIPTSEENNQNSEENGETSEVDHDEIPDFENELEGTTFRGNSKSHIEKVHGSEKPKGPTPMKRLGIKYEPNKTSELTLTQLTEIETKGQQLLALVGDLDPNDERRIIFKSRFEDLLRPYKEELKQKTDKMFSMAE